MANFKSISDIIKSNDFLEAREQRAKYVKHEFQDYANRLAEDLGDIQHRSIYMRLAKTEDRTLLEQAAAFCMDYNDQTNKGKIFMWKLKQLKDAVRKKQIMKDHSHDTVMENMATLFNELSPALIAKQQKDFPNTEPRLAKFLSCLPGKKILVCLAGSGVEVNYLSMKELKVFGLDISSKLVRSAKQLPNKAKVIRKTSLLVNSYKDQQFDAIYSSRLWELVPFGSESDYLDEFRRILKPGGILYLEALVAQDPSQYWQEFSAGEQEYIRFKKINFEEDFLTKLLANKFEIQEILGEGEVRGYLTKLIDE